MEYFNYIRSNEKIIKLEVKDNGNGCKFINKGIGLTNIEDKINNVEGKIIFNSEEGFGVIILISY
ncbi:hypothetical protein NSA50_07515 [Clostridium sp. DSM 100503]|uniref:hypothetical protein n=1 Tax=Clostridium sp. DSM 100503 TaxID=2963282 RepID=UPI00214A78ED|nr:hypothetical protein [Clostridium sp. DSM 100503]MCR1950908.1 hypothetical protein [Clostridium sp. DSM 100503]